MQTILKKPEIMSPAGYWPQIHAAIEAGADAVYFGLKHFSARAKVGFDLAELPELMRTLRSRSVRGYLTFNTLVFDHELGEAAKALAEIARANVDAVIVQDIGVAALASKIAPDLEIHGSTQMSITSAEGVALAQQFGVSRVVLARELSLDEIRDIRAQTDCELEMFVHGALCVSYSGQCFSSEAWGGRSANRGQCAQACRLPYELIVDGALKPLGEARYLLSPGDLYALQQIPDIVKLGISSLKIEGRYKDANYVALTTAAYRKAVDESWAGHRLSVSRNEEIQLEQVYSRGLGPYFVTGTNHQAVVLGRSPRHRGVLMGIVRQIHPDGVIISPEPTTQSAPLKPGDGVVFDAADWRSPQQKEEGGRLYQVKLLKNGQYELRFGNGAIDFARVRTGDWVWRSDDPDLDKIAKPLIEAHGPVRKQPINVAVEARVGQPLRTIWSLAAYPTVRAVIESAEPLRPAQKSPISEAQLREQFGRLGNTAYDLLTLSLAADQIDGQLPFIPSSELNDMRRRAIEEITVLQAAPPQVRVGDPSEALSRAMGAITASPARQAIPELHLLVRTPEQLDAALECAPASITLDYLELYGLRPAVERVQAAGITARVASPRILKPNEQRVVNFLLKLDCQILVRSAGLLQSLRLGEHPELIGDFSLNAANALTARALLDLGLSMLTPTYDLNAAQIADLARAIGPEALEVVAYQHLPVFHTEHCVFCRFMSNGTSYKDCGHPCETHRVALRDEHGREHPVMADVGCRNTVFGAQAQEASHYLDAMRRAGIHHYRLEFVHESADQVRRVAKAFSDALTGAISSQTLGQTLRVISPQGTTEGSLFVPEDYLKVPMMA